MTRNLPAIILVKPQLPENIGMVARAMDNCGLKKLILVSPREKWPSVEAIKASANSKDIFKSVKIYKSLNESLLKFNHVIATSNRRRFLQKPIYNNFNKVFNKINTGGKIAFIFGPENSGLSNDDLMLCDSILNINLSKSNASLNLSHAVLLVAYEYSKYFEINKVNKFKKNDLASKKEFDFFMQFLKKELDSVGFLNPIEKQKSMFNNIQTMFLRSELSSSEIKTLWGMIKKLRNSSK